MLIVAVRALDQPLIYAMPKWHVELGFLLYVTVVAKVRLRLHKELFARFRMMRRVAVNATDLVQAVERIRTIEMIGSGSMAGEATLIDHRRGYVFRFEVKDKLLCRRIFRFGSFGFQFRLGVSFARAMASFAIGVRAVFGQFIGGTPFGSVRMDGFRNLLPSGAMTAKASLNSRK